MQRSALHHHGFYDCVLGLRPSLLPVAGPVPRVTVVEGCRVRPRLQGFPITLGSRSVADSRVLYELRIVERLCQFHDVRQFSELVFLGLHEFRVSLVALDSFLILQPVRFRAVPVHG